MRLQSSLALISILIASVSCSYVSYPRPPIYVKSPHFSLAVNGTYMYTVNYAGYDYVQLSMDEGHLTEFRITAVGQKEITSYSISPRQLPISATVVGRDLVFSVYDAHYLIVKINNLKEFVILADPAETDVPCPYADNVYNALDYSADNTGGSVTRGIQDAVDAAAEHPGSIVYVPPGLYTIGNLLIRNQTSLYLAGGSVLRFTGNPSDYTTLYTKSDLGPGTWWIQTEIDSTDIKVYGRGTIDGNGYNTRNIKFMADLLVPVGTKNFKLDGVLVRDSSFWAVSPIQVVDAIFTNLKVLDRHDVTKNGGIGVIESQRVTVRRAIAIANDDSFSTKTWPYSTGTTIPYPYAPRPLSDVVFEDCLAWTDSYGYRVGPGAWEDQDNVTFRNSVVYTAGVGFGIDHEYGSKTSRNIIFDNIEVEALHGNIGRISAWLSLLVEVAGSGVASIEDVVVKNIRAREKGVRGYVQGYSSSAMVNGVTFSNIYMLDNTAPATTLEEMNLNVSYSKGVEISNS